LPDFSHIRGILMRFPRIAKRYDAAREMFLKHGHWAVFAARFITGLRVFAGILAGVMRMPLWSFLLYSFAGAVCWGFAIGLVGFLFGSSWGTLVHVVGRMDRIALAVIAGGAVVLFVIRTVRRKRLT
jgi:membrane protein DedA with SNARE-associated domain